MKACCLILAALPLLCGCGRVPGPSVSLVNVKFKDATVLETTTLFTIRLSNEATEARQFTGSAHKIYLNGLYLGKGLSDEAITVPRLGTITQDITVHLSNLALATRLKSVIEGKRFDYRIQSTFYGKRWWDRLSSEAEGKLDLKDFTPTEDATNAPPAEVRPGPPPSQSPAPPTVEAGTNSPPL